MSSSSSVAHTWATDMSAKRGACGTLPDAVARPGARPAAGFVLVEDRELVLAEEEGDRLSEPELISMCVLLLIAGHETTANLIGNGMLALLRHPKQLRRLRNDPSLTESAVEEMLRYDSPVQTQPRAVTQDVELRGVTVRRHKVVLPMFGAANRDPEVFSSPDEFDLGRTDNRHLALGQGIHFCLGAPLARLEARIALSALLRRFPAIELRAENPRWRPNWFLRGLAVLSLAV